MNWLTNTRSHSNFVSSLALLLTVVSVKASTVPSVIAFPLLITSSYLLGNLLTMPYSSEAERGHVVACHLVANMTIDVIAARPDVPSNHQEMGKSLKPERFLRVEECSKTRTEPSHYSGARRRNSQHHKSRGTCGS